MVPMSERRHRLYSHELPEVIEGLRLRLERLLEERADKERAEVAFRTLYRLLNGCPGRPKYPKFSWKLLQQYLDQYVPLVNKA
jgi:hypothetical protein